MEWTVDSILEENNRRLAKYEVTYNPVTGEGAPGKRVPLCIPDFVLPVQYVPEEMMKNKFVQDLVRCKSIKNFLRLKKGGKYIQTEHDVELALRRIRHRYDFLFWAYFCIKIKPKKRKRGDPPMIRFYLNYAQLVVFEKCEELRLAGEPIDIIICKARQWGGSTFCIFYQFWLTMKWDNSRSFTVAAHEQTASETIFGMLQNTIKEYPAWDLGLPEGSKIHFAPAGKSGHSYGIKDENNNLVITGLIYIGTAENPDSLRGKDISGIHMSEVGVWKDTPKKKATDLVADLQGGLLEENPYTMQVMESTAKRSDDFFHDTWIECINGCGGYAPIFIPWYFIPHDRRPIHNLREFAQWLLDNKDNDNREPKWKDTGKHYWWLWTLGAPLEGINWYRYKRLKQLVYSQMQNEAPSTWEEAFVAAGTKVFDTYDVAEMRRYCREPRWVGNLFSEARRGEDLLTNIEFIEKENGNLKIWEKPDDSPVNHRYVVAVDIGGPNITSDYSSVRVMDRLLMMPEFEGRPSIVAEMHYHTSHHELVYDAVRLAKWYNNALLVIESNTLETHDDERDVGGDGSQYILDVASEIYSNLYARDASPEDIREGKPTKWGFHTNTKTKPEIIDFMQVCVAKHMWDEPSKICMDEISMYVDDHGEFTAPAGKHDDELMATAILLSIAFRKMPKPTWKITETRVRNERTIAHF